MTNLQRFIRLLISLALLSICASTQTPTPVAPVSNPCAPRFAAGSVVSNPPAVFSSNGVLNVNFSYQETTDSVGRLLHCLMTDTGLQEPTCT
jgi:hypothetical protein